MRQLPSDRGWKFLKCNGDRRRFQQWSGKYPGDPGAGPVPADGRKIPGLYYRRGSYALYGGLQRAFKNPGGASVLRYLYSGDDRGAPDPDHGIIPVPKIRFPENYGGYDHGALKRADGGGTDAGGGTGASLSGEGGRRLHAGCFKPSGSVRRVPFRRNPNL